MGETGPGDHAAQKTVGFAHRSDGIEAGARNQSKVAGTIGTGMDELLHESIEEPRGETFESGFAGACRALAVDDVVALLVALDHFGDDIEGIL